MENISLPEVDDKLFYDIFAGIVGYPGLLVAHDLGLFSLLEQKPLSLDEICSSLNLAIRPTKALLKICLSLGLIKFSEGFYSLSRISEIYLLESSPNYYGATLDMSILRYSSWSFENFKKAVKDDYPLSGKENPFNSSKSNNVSLDPQLAFFIQSTHSLSLSPSLAWPSAIDLSNFTSMLDIGGGSASHSISAVRKWPNLKSTILELPQVSIVSKQFISQYGLEDRISIYPADMWSDGFPSADIHLYSAVFHDWTREKCLFLARKSFESLVPGGQIIIHEMLCDEGNTTPHTIAALNFEMLLWVKGQEFSASEIVAILEEAGFSDIKVKNTFGYYGIVTGRKYS